MDDFPEKPTLEIEFHENPVASKPIRHSDGTLRYVGGHNRVLAVDSSITCTELVEKLKEFCGYSVELKCPLPNGDLETLIAVKSDEDLANIIEEHGRASSPLRPLKIRAILAPQHPGLHSSPPISAAQSIPPSIFPISRSLAPPTCALSDGCAATERLEGEGKASCRVVLMRHKCYSTSNLWELST
ncbi:hypothetical protein COP2_037896 [Malus domestica]